MALPSSSKSKLTMRLIIDTKKEKVLWAETSKPVVDILLHMSTLPLGTVVKLLGKNGMVGAIGNLYQSVEDLDEAYMHPVQSKDHLLNPTASISSDEFRNLFPTIDNHDISSKPHYILVAADLDKDDEQEEDEDEDEKMEEENCCVINSTNAEENKSIKNGFVEDVFKYLVMDDLVIQPITSVIDIFLKFNMHHLTIKEMVVELGVDEVGIFYHLYFCVISLPSNFI